LVAIACATLTAGTAMCPEGASAVLVVQHAIPKASSGQSAAPATSIFNGPQGLLIAGTGAGIYQTVTMTPAFSVKPGPAGQTGSAFFVGPDGQTWFAGGVLQTVEKKQVARPTLDEITPSGTVAVLATYPSPTDLPLSGATGTDGAAWIAEGGKYRLNRLVPGGALELLPMSGGPDKIVSGPAGSLWTVDANGTIGQVKPGGEIVERLIPAAGLLARADAYDLVVGPEGALWFTRQNRPGAIARMTPTGEFESFPIPTKPGLGPLEQGWPAPRFLTVGPEGAIWFTDPGSNAVGRVLDGAVTEYPIPSESQVIPEEIVTVGNELWFDEADSASLGSINPTAQPTDETPKAAATLTAAQVLQALTVSRHATRIAELLKSGGYTATVTLPTAGTATITWLNAKRVPVAQGSLKLGAAGSRKVKVRLTAAGKSLLKHAKSLKLTARGTFTLVDTAAVTASRSVTVNK
jgi:streptogramin lyase